MKKILLFVFVAMFAVTSISFAESKIAVVDMQKALETCDAGKASLEKIKNNYKIKQSEIQVRQQKLQKMQEELNNQSSLLSEDARQAKLEEYQKELVNLKRFVQDSNAELKKKEKDAVSKISRQLAKVVRSLGKELKYDLVLEARTSGAIYFSEKVDITNMVIDRYNKEWNAKK
jgi:outer membrane protein